MIATTNTRFEVFYAASLHSKWNRRQVKHWQYPHSDYQSFALELNPQTKLAGSTIDSMKPCLGHGFYEQEHRYYLAPNKWQDGICILPRWYLTAQYYCWSQDVEDSGNCWLGVCGCMGCGFGKGWVRSSFGSRISAQTQTKVARRDDIWCFNALIHPYGTYSCVLLRVLAMLLVTLYYL